jgi:hypothetical protein
MIPSEKKFKHYRSLAKNLWNGASGKQEIEEKDTSSCNMVKTL